MPIYRTDTLVAADGTPIRYRCYGAQGPGIVLVHGGLQAAQSFHRLAELLSAHYRVYVPDRRGRRPESPAGDGYGLATEGEDLDALMRAVDARRVFGLSSGATIALYTALQYRRTDGLALYEPPLTIDGVDPAAWVPHFRRALAAGHPIAALVEVIKGTGGEEFVARLPRAVLIALLGPAIAVEARFVSGDSLAVKDLIPTMYLDSVVQSESVTMVNPRIAELAGSATEVLLLGGERSTAGLRRGLEAIAARVPACRHIELEKQSHIAADNRGAPDTVAAPLAAFFAA